MLLAAVALPIYLLAWSAGPYLVSDSSSYLEAARQMAGDGPRALPLRTPGYPLFLLLTGSAEAPGRTLLAAQLLLFFCAAVAASRLLRELGARESLVLGFVAVCSLPHVVQPAALVLAESLAQSLLTLGFVCFGYGILRRRTALLVASGSLLGACALVRPEYQLAGVLLAAIYLGGRRLSLSELRPKAAGALAIVLPTVILVGSVAAHNQARFGATGSRLLTLSLALRTGNYLESLPEEHAGVREILLRHRNAELVENRHHRVRGYVHRAWPELVDHFGGDQVAARQALRATSIEVMKREPRAMLLEIGRSFPYLWEWVLLDPPGIRVPGLAPLLLILHYSTVLLFWLCAAVAVVALILTAGSAGGWSLTRALALPRGFGRVLLAGLGVVLLNMLIQSTLGVGVPRYRLPTELLILVAVFLFLEGLARARAGVSQLRLAEAAGAAPRQDLERGSLQDDG